LKKGLSAHVIIEGLLVLYFGFGLYSAFVVGDQGGDFGLFPFHLMLFFGFGFVFLKSIKSEA
ncbi:MAG: glycosyl transferase family 2, partial [Bacteroidia bacterium]|nr:glycosyl transferase family 2 [Bacteroidia bacterium]